MMKNYLLVSCSLLCTVSSFADICPTIEAIQHNRLDGWNAFDSDNGDPLSREQFQSYQNNLSSFAEADYFEDAAEGPAQCYYNSINDPYYGDAYLAKKQLKADFNHAPWQWRSTYNAVCTDSLENCLFMV